MKKNIVRVALAAAAVPALLFAGVGTANATPTFDVVPGREKLKVVLKQEVACTVSIDNNYVGDQFQDSDRSKVYLVGPGTHNIRLACRPLSGGPLTPRGTETVDVLPADPVLDAIDAALGAAGSSQLSTDPALRP